MSREEMVARAANRGRPWDMVIVGGGATGAGAALDAAARGYEVLLLERGDFGSGTSSRSTKLAHGGVRYLRQGHFKLVFEALRERERLLRNAPHIVHELSFVIPCYSRLDRAFYGAGLKAYDLLARSSTFGRSSIVSAKEVLRIHPNVQPDGLAGGVIYTDGLFDDARLVIELMRTAIDSGATALNYAPVANLTRSLSGTVDGVVFLDLESGEEIQAAARVVINAAGPFCDEIRHLAKADAPPIVAASRGSHLVLDSSFLPGTHAVMIPKMPDGRVMFAIPWLGQALIGTTDVAVPFAEAEPVPSAAEVDSILEAAGRFLTRRPARSDVLSAFAGIRPLVSGGGEHTAKLSRDFSLRDDIPGLVTITGGKWTTYRSMAEACITRAAATGGLPAKECLTATLPLHGARQEVSPARASRLGRFGADRAGLEELIASDSSLAEALHPRLPYLAAEVVWAARHELARSVEDVLARRTRSLFLNAAAAVESAPRVAQLLAKELGYDDRWIEAEVTDFSKVAVGYRI